MPTTKKDSTALLLLPFRRNTRKYASLLIRLLLGGVAAPFEGYSLLDLVAGETFFANIVLWSSFSVSQLFSRRQSRKARFSDRLEIEGKDQKKSIEYGDIEYMSTQYPTKYRTRIHLHLEGEEEDLVIPSNPRSSKLRRRLFPWLKERIPVKEDNITPNQEERRLVYWGLVPSIVLSVAITVGFVFGGIIFPTLIFAGSVGSILWLSWIFLTKREESTSRVRRTTHYLQRAILPGGGTMNPKRHTVEVSSLQLMLSSEYKLLLKHSSDASVFDYLHPKLFGDIVMFDREWNTQVCPISNRTLRSFT